MDNGSKTLFAKLGYRVPEQYAATNWNEDAKKELGESKGGESSLGNIKPHSDRGHLEKLRNWLLSQRGAAFTQWIQAAAIITAAASITYTDLTFKNQKTEYTFNLTTELNEEYREGLELFRETLPPGLSSAFALTPPDLNAGRQIIMDNGEEGIRIALFLSRFIDCHEINLCNRELTLKTLCQPATFYKRNFLDFLLPQERPHQANKIDAFVATYC